MEMAEEHSTRRHKRSKGEQKVLSVDRLSDLPDSVLTHILSFLPTKFSARTSVLGKRWRVLWAYVSNLVFDYENPDTIHRVLLLHKLQKINTFRLSDGVECNTYQIYTWITFAVERNVRNLDIDLCLDVVLPRCLFTCKSLVDLRLVCCGAIPNVGGVFCLPRLKKLSLIHIQYNSDESLCHLLSGCPVLEELVIQSFIDYCPCKISSPTIKRLSIIAHSDGEASDNHDYYHRVEINTPVLVYLQLLDRATQHIKCGALTSLIQADIDLYNNMKPQDEFVYSRSVVEFIDRLRNVECLKLDLAGCGEIVDSVFVTWKSLSFPNLTKLELATDCCFLSKFLENADKLEILIFSKVRNENKGWTEPQQVPTCLLSHLRTIKLVSIEGEKHELEYIRYLLRNCQVLEIIEIVYPRLIDPEKKIHMLQEITRFRRGSKECEVVFISQCSIND